MWFSSLIINILFKNAFDYSNSINLNHGSKRSLKDYGHDDSEWGHKDNSEELEWDEHYRARNRKWTDESNDHEHE